MNLFKNIVPYLTKYRLTITILLPFLFFVLFTTLFISFTPSTVVNQNLSPAPSPSLTQEQETNQFRVSEKVNIEDRHDLDNPQDLPGLQRQETLPDGGVQYVLSSSINNRPNLINTTTDGFIDFKRSVIPESHPLFLKDFINLYGEARWVFIGSIFYSDKAKTYIYPDYGIALIVDSQNNRVLEQHSFTNTTVEEYLRKYGDDIPAIPEP